jgi:NAD(P)-dependent dehydrogenase (short-subunit alcohol dehydrogenase family)
MLIRYHQSRDIQDFTSEIVFTVTAPLNLLREFLPLVRKSETKRALFVTSILGSIEVAPNLPNLMNSYSVARAALNM